ncbi:hypothetical protein NEUTE1DRAFT_79349 [Neurospora tetrasperma FGSC 2508]|uniref:F-box domain-containing protein n=1 Tax=Neurospora tetrasperma (strain FGSC 2508 / ATCC MYA-4615 / P0657) TaxID=510951 RepID=F8MFX1_NEUT8|nr:uncharacterized protein NEUTE1DRAFT_79349 [Neurospora tetrasperma FGSC 2508]EGO59347.1 hypothetical protein NEUTE1DRAFT_79349 [Neurospora tetrasperma FGSC 2508]
MASPTRRYKCGPAPPYLAPQIPGSDPLNSTTPDGQSASNTELLTKFSEHASLERKPYTDVHVGLTSPAARKPSFMELPAEIHLLITEQLIYPDALSMKHVNRYLYNLVDTGVRKKVEWLVQCHFLCSVGESTMSVKPAPALGVWYTAPQRRPNIMNNSTCSDQGSFYPLCLNSESKPFTFRIQKPSPTLVSAGSTTLISCAGFALASSMFESRPLYCEEKKKKEKKQEGGCA